MNYYHNRGCPPKSTFPSRRTGRFTSQEEGIRKDLRKLSQEIAQLKTIIIGTNATSQESNARQAFSPDNGRDDLTFSSTELENPPSDAEIMSIESEIEDIKIMNRNNKNQAEYYEDEHRKILKEKHEEIHELQQKLSKLEEERLKEYKEQRAEITHMEDHKLHYKRRALQYSNDSIERYTELNHIYEKQIKKRKEELEPCHNCDKTREDITEQIKDNEIKIKSYEEEQTDLNNKIMLLKGRMVRRYRIPIARRMAAKEILEKDLKKTKSQGLWPNDEHNAELKREIKIAEDRAKAEVLESNTTLLNDCLSDVPDPATDEASAGDIINGTDATLSFYTQVQNLPPYIFKYNKI